MNLFDFLAQLRALDIQLSAENGKLRINAPKGAVTPAIKSELAAHKADLLALLTETTPIVRVSREAPLPLSVAQEQLWQLLRLTPDNSAYNMYIAFRLCGPLDIAALEKALHAVSERHEILRTTFPKGKDGTPIQAIGEPTVLLQRESVADATDPYSSLEAIIAAEVRRPFDLQAGPLFRPTLVKVNSAEHVLILLMHHTISDGQSFAVFYDELDHAYRQARGADVPDWDPLPLQYADYAVWQRNWLASDAGAAARTYWQTQLANDVPSLLLPVDHHLTQRPAADGQFIPLHFEHNLIAALRKLARREGVTLFTVFLTAFDVLLQRHTGQTKLLVCTPVAGRDRAEFGRMIGYFNNTLLLYTDFHEALTLRDALQQTHSTVMDALAQQTFPFSEVASFPNLAHTPLSRAMVVVQDSAEQTLRLSGIDVETIPTFNDAVQYDLSLEVTAADAHLQGKLTYRASLFERETVMQLAAELIGVLEEMVADLDGEIGRITSPDAYPDTAQVSVLHPYIAPHTDLERNLARVWQDVLGIERVGIDDNFFELGGHSLSALRLFTQIREEFDVHLPLATLFEATTVAQLARLISENSDNDQWSSLVPIQPLGDKTPLFCIHGLTGDVLWFRLLGELLAPHQPFYGVRARGLDGVSEPFDDMAAMAAFYIDEIKRVQPEGPYFLGGASLGGTVALEMAHQLAERGETVALLVMFDHAPYVADDGSQLEKLSRGALHVVGNFPHWTSAMRELGSRQVMQRVRRKARVGWKRIAGRWMMDKANGVDSADLLDYGSELPAFRQRMIEAHWQAIAGYHPQPYDQPVLLLQAQAQPLLSTRRPDIEWHTLARGPLSIITVPGSHEGIFKEPHVQTLADELRFQLNGAQKALHNGYVSKS
ncbi:MAG: condensation domain-containing protein [Anaerolineae bacterium]|nr:condensation domain-containing protein [Anaerolineae bacterium]